MKKYDATFIYAFTPLNNEEKAHGNPALVVFGDPSEEEKKLISTQARVSLNGDLIEVPIITFVVPVEGKENEYSIKYRFCDGTPVSVCGHGSMATSKALVDRFNIKGDVKFKLHLDQSFEDNRTHPYLEITTNGTSFTICFDDTWLKKMEASHPISQVICKNVKGVNTNYIYETGLRDYIFICEDAKELRDAHIEKEELLKIRSLNNNYRALMAVAVSDRDGYDYETTVFSDGLPAPTYRDPACGSANKQIPLMIKMANLFPNRFKNGSLEKFRMYYPFLYNKTGVMGGLQTVDYYHNEGKIYVNGGVQAGSKLVLEIDGDEVAFKELGDETTFKRVNMEKLNKDFFDATDNLKPIVYLLGSAPVVECGKEMVNVHDVNKDIMIALHKTSKELHNLKDNACFLRRTVVEKLSEIQNLLSKKGLGLKIVEGFRSHAVQHKMWENAYNVFKKDFPHYSHEELVAQTNTVVAPIDIGVTPHSTGGAFDITLVDENGDELDMGTKYLELNEKTKMNSDKITKEQRENRDLLRNSMENAGFVTYPLEWWHYCYGDQMWAIVKKQDYAFYDNVKDDSFLKKHEND